MVTMFGSPTFPSWENWVLIMNNTLAINETCSQQQVASFKFIYSFSPFAHGFLSICYRLISVHHVASDGHNLNTVTFYNFECTLLCWMWIIYFSSLPWPIELCLQRGQSSVRNKNVISPISMPIVFCSYQSHLHIKIVQIIVTTCG